MAHAGATVKSLQSRLAERRKMVLIAGDAMVDCWVIGEPRPSQDGCDKFMQNQYVETLGGSENAKNCLREWGVTVRSFSYPSLQYPKKYRFLEGGRIVFRWDDDKDSQSRYSPWMYDELMGVLPSAAAVLLSDYDKGFLAPEFVRRAVGRCEQLRIPCVVDAKRESSLYKGAIVKANGAWGADNCWSLPDNYVETRGAAFPGVKCNGSWVSVTVRAQRGVQCVNHVGAGDCFAAHLTLALAYDFSLVEAAVLAHSAGRVYVQHPFNRPPQPAEIALDLDSFFDFER